jgi:hypothetical protein
MLHFGLDPFYGHPKLLQTDHKLAAAPVRHQKLDLRIFLEFFTSKRLLLRSIVATLDTYDFYRNFLKNIKIDL